MNFRHSSALILAATAAMAATAAAAAPAAPALPLYVAQPLAGAHVMFGDFDVQQPLTAAAGRMDNDPKLPGAVVEARRTAKDTTADALGLTWKKAWFSTVRVESAPLDLRPYLARGTVSFDLKVNELAKGGLTYRVDCGHDCERKVVDVIDARAAQGKGWRHLSYALSCFYRKGDDFSAVTTPFALDGTGDGDVEIANIRIDAAGKANEACPDYRTASVTPSPLNESWSLDWWMPRHKEKLAEIARRKAAGEPTDLVFIGDSITHNWEKNDKPLWDEFWGKYHALNLGYGGDRTENVLWRLEHGEIDGIPPKVAVMMIGTNNTGHRHEAPELIYAGIKRDIQEIRKHLPRTKILLLAIFPRGEKPDDDLRLNNEKVNALLPGLADGKHVFFLNFGKAFLAPDGTLSKTIFPDLLHPNGDGYKIWQREMQPTLDKLMR
ncbi:GDSL-type esterase/lipase family protein [Massilia sp. Root335]|uniref:GDSL-type esterase/lipase family protein n=1 Tax=Massilia sp. Root335 TaxID=1736517 RepID=UPI0006F35571|nr:GDSL-type esterase/lipase family protein [Massilia sp. Root335]KQV36793.1 1,4-beta-D-glucan glucohydrolase [Massilia sp. Root335]